MGRGVANGAGRWPARKILLAAVVVLAVPLILLALLFITGKYRLLTKPRPAESPESSSGGIQSTTGKTGTAAVKVADNSVKMEYVIRNYTLDFYMGRPRYMGSPSVQPRSSSMRMPAVEIPPSIRLICGLEKAKGYIERNHAVNALGASLSDKEVTALLYFLHKKVSDDNLQPVELGAVKNDAVIVLMRQTRCPEELAPHLVAMYLDRTLDNLWRDYCIQFMGQWYGGTHIPGMQDLMRRCLEEALSDADNIPAAAIISMSNLAGKPGFPPEKISAAALKLSADPEVRDSIKTAALQVCAKFKNRNVLPLAREIIRISPDVPLKMSAVATLGAFGETADRELINSLASSGDVRMRTAATAALKKIKM